MSLTINLPIPQLKKKKSQQINIHDVPSLVHQAEMRGWSAGEYDFRKGIQPNEDYFNPSIVDRPDGRWLLVRRSRRDPEIRIGVNDLLGFTLINNTPMTGWPVVIPKSHPREHTEDGRIWFLNGKTYVGCCHFYMPDNRTWSGARYLLNSFIPDSRNQFGKVGTRYDIDYQNNGKSLQSKGRRMQKNWIGWGFEGRLILTYSGSPHINIEVNEKSEVVKEYRSEQDLSSVWKFGEVRGGTPPVFHDGLFYSFFHSSLPWQNDRRQYYCGVYAYEPHPPFKIVKITPEPILAGSRYDAWFPTKPLVVFPGGALMEKNEDWLIVYGINDLKSGWARIPHSALQPLLVSVV